MDACLSSLPTRYIYNTSLLILTSPSPNSTSNSSSTTASLSLPILLLLHLHILLHLQLLLHHSLLVKAHFNNPASSPPPHPPYFQVKWKSLLFGGIAQPATPKMKRGWKAHTRSVKITEADDTIMIILVYIMMVIIIMMVTLVTSAGISTVGATITFGKLNLSKNITNYGFLYFFHGYMSQLQWIHNVAIYGTPSNHHHFSTIFSISFLCQKKLDWHLQSR